MAFIPTPNGIEVALKMTQTGVPCVNVFNIDNGGTPSLTDLQTVASIVNAWITTDYAPLIHGSVSFDSIVVTDISVANSIQWTEIPTTPNGTHSGDAEAANASLVVSWRTAQIGRSFRGRTYIPGLATTAVGSSHEVTTTYQSSVVTAFGNLLTSLAAVGKVLSVLSKYANLVARVTGLLTEITTLIVNTKIDSQRRRTAN